MKTIIIICLAVFNTFHLFAQDTIPDSLFNIKLDEVVVKSKALINYNKQSKPLSTLDEYLERAPNISLVKRGNYAWEPMLNNMTTERINVTIDGMHVFGACTDKMDPITSYVDVSNLSEINVTSGQKGSVYGPTIGGAIELTQTKHDFCHPGWSGNIDMGFESNANLYTIGTALKYVHQKFFINTDFMFRDAGNYKAGKRTTVPFSQYTKYNLSTTVGWKINDKNTLQSSVIFDRAKDVGYPALPMDVSKAQAIIASVQHTIENVHPIIQNIETKIYYNNVQHIMDDTKRPAVPIHMDMPGLTNTYGMYSKMNIEKGKHEINLNINTYHNQSKAEMTMYPKDTSEQIMFMYTWPDIRTTYVGAYLQDKMYLHMNHSISYAASIGYQRTKIASEMGLNSLKIFYPTLAPNKNRAVMGTSFAYAFQKKNAELNLSFGYGQRTPSVSEAYGFYLFNSFDKYDYIGNPFLKNEQSIESEIKLSYSISKIKTQTSLSYFHIYNYIIGKHNPTLLPMTIGASGVREYTALKHVNLVHLDWSLEYKPIQSIKTKAYFKYSFGQDYQKQNLPLISPFSYRFSLAYYYKGLELELSVDGAAKQNKYSKTYGEDLTKAYALLHFSAGYFFTIKEHHRIYIKAGIENIVDTYYSTFSDWNNIPRKGRNFFVNISFAFDKASKTK